MQELDIQELYERENQESVLSEEEIQEVSNQVQEMPSLSSEPYFCPNCRSNRVKFSFIRQTTQEIMKDAVNGIITEHKHVEELEEPLLVRCRVCQFTGDEMRFIKQAEREPRVMTPTEPVY